MKKILTIALFAIAFNASAATSDDWDFADWADWCGDVWEPSVAAENDFYANMMFGDNVEFHLGRNISNDERVFIEELEVRGAH